jgi:hypothetical protein
VYRNLARGLGSDTHGTKEIICCTMVTIFLVGSEALTTSSAFWDVALFTTLNASLRFGRICRLCYQGRKISQLCADSFLELFFFSEDGGEVFFQNIG